MYRIFLGAQEDQELKRRADKSRRSYDDLATAYVLAGIERDSLHTFRSLARFVSGCVLTALFVVAGLIIVSSSWGAVGAFREVSWIDFVDWVGKFLRLFAPWPITILIGLSIIAKSESSFALLLGLFGQLRRIKLFGAEFELNEQTKRRIQSANAEIDYAIQEYKKRVDKEVERVASHYQVEQALSRFLDSDVMKKLRPNSGKFRCTIHIPDPIRDDRLYQLLNYLPSGDGRGRTFSARYGIIGKVWRTDSAILAGNLFSLAAGERAPTTHEEKIDKVMSEWGMDRREAERALKHLSYFCFPLTCENSKVGVVYLDSDEANAFNSDFKNWTEEEAATLLAPIVYRLTTDLASISLRIDQGQ